MIGTSIGNSLIWDNGTNVGIGNTNTTYNLDVTGTGRFTGALNGTSATFSGALGIGNSSYSQKLVLQNGTLEVGILLTDGTNNTYFAHAASNGNFANGSIAGDAVVRSTNGISFSPNNGSATTLRIASTGAATFSSSVSVGQGLVVTAPTSINMAGGQQTDIIGSMENGGVSIANISNSSTSTSSDPSPGLNIIKGSTTTSSSARFIQFYAGNFVTPMGGIVGNGASNVQFASLSDIREKENITSIEGSLTKILALNPVEFDWIKTGEHIKAGFVAQQVEEIFPEYVVENMSNNGDEERKGLTGGMSSGIIAHLVKAIQEQQAQIQNLQEQINILAK